MNTRNLSARCPNCGDESFDVREITEAVRWSSAPGAELIPVVIPVMRCNCCDCQWKDYRAEEAQAEALRQYLNRKNWVLLWLDDVRPAPVGWTHVKTVEAAKALLSQGNVYQASLDHDLGDDEHIGTGYTLVCWMEETGHWPINGTVVHSANPVGRRRMQIAIDRWYTRQQQSGQRL